MMRLLIVSLIVSCFWLLPQSAIAQAQNPVEQRIAAQIGSLVIQNTALIAQVEQLAAENAKLKAELEKLKKPSEK